MKFTYRIVQIRITKENLLISSHKTIEQAEKALKTNNQCTLNTHLTRKMKGNWVSPFIIEKII